MPVAVERRVDQDAALTPVASPQTKAVAAVVLFSRIPGDLQSLRAEQPREQSALARGPKTACGAGATAALVITGAFANCPATYRDRNPRNWLCAGKCLLWHRRNGSLDIAIGVGDVIDCRVIVDDCRVVDIRNVCLANVRVRNVDPIYVPLAHVV